jgi:hypothetical protein
MFIELCVSSSFLASGPHFQLTLPSTGSPRLGFPGFLGTTARSDSSASVPRHFVAFARRYHAASTSHAGAMDASCLRGVGSGPPPVVRVEMSRPPRFLGSPLRACPALRPRRGRGHQVVAVSRCCLPEMVRRRPLHVICLEARSHGLHARCLRFAAEITLAPRKTRFRLGTSLIRAGLGTRGTPVKVSESGHRSPSPGLPGAHHLPSR